MKTKFYLIALVLVSTLISSCESDDLNYQDDFEKSRNAFEDFKKETNNSYSYTVTFGSWVGFAWETTITISEGIPIERHFKRTTINNSTEYFPVVDTEWTEKENEIGNHKDQGAEALTLDQIYAKAKEDWLVKRKQATTYFEAKNNGLLSSAGYTPEGCADDCFIGIHIKNIKALSLK